jgi:hypothetical protein
MPTCFTMDGSVPIPDSSFLGKLTAMPSPIPIGKNSQESSRGSLPSGLFTASRGEGPLSLVRSTSMLTGQLTGKVDIIPSSSSMTCLQPDEVFEMQKRLSGARKTLSELWYSLAVNVLNGYGRSSR